MPENNSGGLPGDPQNDATNRKTPAEGTTILRTRESLLSVLRARLRYPAVHFQDTARPPPMPDPRPSGILPTVAAARKTVMSNWLDRLAEHARKMAKRRAHRDD